VIDFIDRVLIRINKINTISNDPAAIRMRVFKSILASLVYLVTVADLEGFLYSNFLTIQFLFDLLKKELSISENKRNTLKSKINKYMIEIDENS
jgi:hypothetical protein